MYPRARISPLFLTPVCNKVCLVPVDSTPLSAPHTLNDPIDSCLFLLGTTTRREPIAPSSVNYIQLSVPFLSSVPILLSILDQRDAVVG
jgi:hypothetical protein